MAARMYVSIVLDVLQSIVDFSMKFCCCFLCRTIFRTFPSTMFIRCVIYLLHFYNLLLFPSLLWIGHSGKHGVVCRPQASLRVGKPKMYR
jgi:hypothetical protein